MEGGRDICGDGHHWFCRLEAMITLLLRKFLLPGPSLDTISGHLFPMAIAITWGERLPLAPLVLGQFYKQLELVSEDEVTGAGCCGIEMWLSTNLLEVFMGEKFRGYAPKLVSLDFAKMRF